MSYLRVSMSGAFEQAWLLLKAAFQPIDADEVLGQGKNQTVLGQLGNPDVTKVGGVMGAEDMYWQNRLASLMPQRFVSQQPSLLNTDLPSHLSESYGHTLPIMSTQERGTPLTGARAQNPNLSEIQADKINAMRGREIARTRFRCI